MKVHVVDFILKIVHFLAICILYMLLHIIFFSMTRKSRLEDICSLREIPEYHQSLKRYLRIFRAESVTSDWLCSQGTVCHWVVASLWAWMQVPTPLWVTELCWHSCLTECPWVLSCCLGETQEQTNIWLRLTQGRLFQSRELCHMITNMTLVKFHLQSSR